MTQHPDKSLFNDGLLAPRAPRRWRLILWAAVGSMAAVLLVAVVTIGIWLHNVGVFQITEQSIVPILKYRTIDNSVVLDRNGKKIGEYFDTYQVFVPYDKLPVPFVNAVVSIEDKNFQTHPGYDWKAMLRAGIDRLRGRPLKQGASTITQQVVRHFLLNHEKSYARKVLEIGLARELEKHMNKARIFEIYANTMFLGNGAYGVGAAAWRYFGKPVDALSPEESALIAGLFQSPSRYNPKSYPVLAKTRQQQVLRAMLRNSKITRSEFRLLAKKPLVYKDYKPLNASIAPWFIDHIREQVPLLLGNRAPDGRGLRIYTTLDTDLETLAQSAIKSNRDILDRASQRTVSVRGADGKLHPPRIEAAALIVNPHTGEILSMVGGRDYASSQFNRAASALRSPGSAFKPAVYATALSRGRHWNDVVFVSPVTINGNYRPHEMGDDLGTETTLLRAFYRSMNNPTVELATQIGIPPIAETAKRMGIDSPLKLEAGLALGGSDVTMMDMARLYSTMANGGQLVRPISITRITNRSGKILWKAPAPEQRTTRALTPQIAWLMTEGMRSVLEVGTGSRSAALANRAVGKTGTSNESRDNWFCGYTSDLVAIVWVGTDEHAEITGLSAGNTLALPIWDNLINGSLRIHSSPRMTQPPRVISAKVNPRYGALTEDGVTMWFVEGTEPREEKSGIEALGRNTALPFRNIFAH